MKSILKRQGYLIITLLIMKKNTKSLNYQTCVVNTDGSTISLNFPYKRKHIFLINDFCTNPLFKSPYTPSEGVLKVKDKNKYLNFDFKNLV